MLWGALPRVSYSLENAGALAQEELNGASRARTRQSKSKRWDDQGSRDWLHMHDQERTAVFIS